MASPASVVGCSTCGALYTPSPGDGRVCEACRITVADDPSARPLPPPTPLFDIEDEPVVRGKGGRSGARPMRRPRSLKRAVVGLLSLAVLVTGATVAYKRRETLEKTWSSLRQRPAAETWTSLRRRSGEAWLALRRLSPIESLRPDPGATVEASAAGLGDTSSTGTHRRSHNKRKRRSADGR